MSFFSKIKQFFGVGTVSAKLEAPGMFKTDDTEISGSVTITGKSDQNIVSVEVVMEEQWSTGKGEDKKEKTFKLGSVKLPGFDIKNGEVKKVDFTLPFTYRKSSNEELAGKGGVLGGIGKLASFASSEKSDFRLVATVDVKGATFDPNDILELKKVN